MGQVVSGEFGEPRPPVSVSFGAGLHIVRCRTISDGLCMVVIAFGRIIGIEPIREDGGPPKRRPPNPLIIRRRAKWRVMPKRSNVRELSERL